MNTANTINALRPLVHTAKMAGKKVVFVPTMGNLHRGHISLIEEAKNHGDFIVVSIFVNPMQFGPNEDLDSYPRTLEADTEKLVAAGANVLFAPNAKEMYPKGLGSQTTVSISALAGKLCGKSRPVFFDGIATVVSKLLNIVQPDTAIFGEKDFQQLMVIRQMVSDLNMPIEIIGVATAREANGLAMSSRNGYLNADQKQLAASLYQHMQSIQQAINDGNSDYEALCDEASAALSKQGFDIDYLDVCNSLSLDPATEADTQRVIIAAVILNGTRLIDNLLV